jgi:hypothetical protein
MRPPSLRGVQPVNTRVRHTGAQPVCDFAAQMPTEMDQVAVSGLGGLGSSSDLTMRQLTTRSAAQASVCGSRQHTRVAV